MKGRAAAFARDHQGVLALLVLLVVGWFLAGAVNATTVTILVLALYYAIGGLSFNFLYGSLGIFSLAQPVFVAVGGYTSIYLYNTHGVSPWLSLLIAPVLAAILALPIALVATRIGGGAVLTALVTLIVAEAATPLLIAIKPLGGAIGLYAKTPAHITFGAMQFDNGSAFVRILLVMNVLFIGFWMWWRQSRFGLFVTAIKEAPETGESVGVANARIRLTVFLIAAMLAAPAGVVFAQYNLLTSPDTFLGATALFQFITVALVGGAARPWGALAGSVLITYLSQEVSDLSGGKPGAAPVTFAVIFVIMALIVPRGLAGTWDRVAERRRPAVNASLGPIGSRAETPSGTPPRLNTDGEDLTSQGIPAS
jgi:branched-chain amino acid transport system permease protein